MSDIVKAFGKKYKLATIAARLDSIQERECHVHAAEDGRMFGIAWVAECATNHELDLLAIEFDDGVKATWDGLMKNYPSIALVVEKHRNYSSVSLAWLEKAALSETFAKAFVAAAMETWLAVVAHVDRES